MTIIMFHSHKENLPDYLEDNFKQLRLFNPTITVYFLTDKHHADNPLFAKYNIIYINKDEYYSDKIGRYILHFKYYNRDLDQQFWVITATRLIYIENFMIANKIKDVYHFENDIMLYYNIESIHDKFKRLYPNMAITVGGPDKCMTGLMFIHNVSALIKMTAWFIKVLRIYGKKQLQRMYKMDMVNEMTLIRAYSREYPNEMAFLPILPFGEFSNNYAEFNSIFDPASWGQWVGETPRNGNRS